LGGNTEIKSRNYGVSTFFLLFLGLRPTETTPLTLPAHDTPFAVGQGFVLGFGPWVDGVCLRDWVWLKVLGVGV
jgi:hypothetical protein